MDPLDDATIVAIDIGGTKIATGRCSAAGELSGVGRRPTPAEESADAMFDAVTSMVDPLFAAGAVTAIGVGVGGPMSVGGADVSPLNIPAWRGFPLRQRLDDRYRVPVSVDNDAKALALGEGRWGAAQGIDNYLAMVVSTGVGGGLVLNGRLLDGEAGNAGHIGHMIVEPDGHTCACGARGCLEAEASGSGIARWAGLDPELADVSVRRRTGTMVGRAVASVANLLDLRLAVVAGSVALGYADEFFPAAQAELDRSCRLEFSVGARIIPAGLGDSGPLLGAAAVALAAER